MKPQKIATARYRRFERGETVLEIAAADGISVARAADSVREGWRLSEMSVVRQIVTLRMRNQVLAEKVRNRIGKRHEEAAGRVIDESSGGGPQI